MLIKQRAPKPEVFHQKRMLQLLTSTGLILISACGFALAQSALPGSTIVLDPIVIGADDNAALKKRFDAMPGGVALVEQSDRVVTANETVSRVLRSVPGVVVQNFFGGNDQPRIQIRGSGLQQNPVERGILMLQDGLPLNRADGSYAVGFANPSLAETIEVYRGYMANRLGATVLGGALNFASPTGAQYQGVQGTVSGGSFGQVGVSGKASFQTGTMDGLFQADYTRRDGFRDYNESERVSVGGNVGFEVTDNIKTRFFWGYTDLGFDVSGPLTKSQLESDPRQVHTGPTITPGGAINPGPNVLRDRPRRDAKQLLIGSRTTAELDSHLFDVAMGYTYTDDTFRFPISAGTRETKGGDFTGVVRYAYTLDDAAPLPLFETTAQYSIGSADRNYYLNQSGTQGAQFGENDLDASTLSLHAGFNVPVNDTITVSPALSYANATRKNDDTYSLSTRPTIAYNPANPTVRLPNGAVPANNNSYDRNYQGWSPSLGVSYKPDDINTFFAAVSRSFEPPTHDDLLATINGTPNSSAGRPTPGAPFAVADAFRIPDLDAQSATTIEAGWRSEMGQFAWDVTTYYSWVNNELLSLRDVTGASLGAINADDTRHFGIELGLAARITDHITGRIAYTYQDFRFHDDPLRGDNQLAGAPRQIINTVLNYEVNERWTLQGAVQWVPEKTPVDNMNTLYSDPYAVVDLRTELKISENLLFFGEVANVFDEKYASSTLIVDQARADQAAFLPGDGRGFFVGLKAKY
ncbi:TonB-dependent receptor [Brucella pseudogrignonensis]|uniref:Heme transporter BhuA n=1 Tax=Brucella pseudogrignonensis TaxID=419475 RepID=A0ABU1MFG0_9HYPH|nr:TonB-dependent receptor [Brucella pseudogrignonensis]MDR6434784.1 iron complex outermembrane receptor protein [Brucella pseudogrignonensis]